MTTKLRIISRSLDKHVPPPRQKSHPNPLDGRGRGRAAIRRAHGVLIAPEALRADFCDRWGALMRHLFVDRESVAVAFGVTFQTACNWFDGTHRPTGDKVALAALSWPEDFTRFMGA